ncbi:putative protein OS=Tsukamurella paurometabola (strain ATCC 8368 / DSM / CCUG 35730 /CIP 100753 / JCM 10117 / KCTC 9821 / NBRC 16120 / NCIMB 702349/ NCTC 13040) OX=521096 GN=Tpau_0197 PE=4 SV=1 [Tsukamurella paurometabola]|uniref:Uncharacterized protein n=1 Tax=Tsukamurella paurometabola (strain ATCC 8368 / DSM 20162 / CCUG 35730 / CIP 100753 / JCM 10117 / KCTC 9821 / NBRC 16120 / NCIMB 702349 / NCTC 13040) TaxID=521096 RepID=D5UQL8_TSUPD|nr:hypothetical protein Tpau_0197 [Tsukamurella paurometabola DSM 20162]SUP41912.1 Uncharacterised protein [Tsukamurella paurometabola]
MALAFALVGVVSAAGCGLTPSSRPSSPEPSRFTRTEAAATTPSVAPYAVDAPGRTVAVAPRPTTGAGITTFADSFGFYASVCTLGFFARYPNGQVVAFTAGHCADLARQARPDDAPVARYLTSASRSTAFGEYIKATRTRRGQDIAIIQVLGADVRAVADAIGPVTGYSTAAELRDGRPEICIVGARTGRSCGVFDTIDGRRVTWAGTPAVEGDSGGPVYARWPDGTFTAVGVVNSVHTRADGTGTGGGSGTLVADDILANSMTLMGTT